MLSSILMESAGTAGLSTVLGKPLGYDEDSANRIAMESAIELGDIFYESFFQMEELDFQYSYATMEGASGAVLEGIGASIRERASGAFASIKDFLGKLWKKIQEFFFNVKRFLTGVFKNAQDFVTKYEKELNALTFSKKGYKVEIYEYSYDKLAPVSGEIYKRATAGAESGDKLTDNLANIIRKKASTFGKDIADSRDVGGEDGSGLEEGTMKEVDAYGKQVIIDIDNYAVGQIHGIKPGFDNSALNNAIWSACRAGATDDRDKKTVNISSLSEYVSFLKTSTNMIKNLDNSKKNAADMFKTAENAIKSAESIVSKVEGDDKVAKATAEVAVKICRSLSMAINRASTISNAINSGIKSAATEKVKVYKKICTSAFSHADKAEKEK